VREEQLQSISAKEIFGGDELIRGENFMRVASSLESLEAIIKDNEVEITEMDKDQDGWGFYSIGRAGQLFGEMINVFSFDEGDKSGL